jgi:cytidyltransferase-like protein
MRVYCDGIFDLFHSGHLKHLKKIHDLFHGEKVELIVGVISDNIAKSYKREPIMNQEQRLKILLSCIYVDDAFITDSLSISEEFLEKYNIDKVVHAFSDTNDKNKQNPYYEIPMKINKFIEIEYNHEEPTTTNVIDSYFLGNKKIDKIENLKWKEIWENKGLENTEDLYLLSGWEDTNFNPESLVHNMVKILNIQKNDKIIEYGCGCGLLSTFLKEYEYYGLDYSASLVSKNINLLKNMVVNFNSTEVIFKDKYFDFVIINSMFEYLSSNEELVSTLNEIERISKNGIYIANIRKNTRSEKTMKHKYDGEFTHFIVDDTIFDKNNYIKIDSLYDENRYDVYKIKLL